MALIKKYYSGSQVFDIIRELPDKEFLLMLNAFAKASGADAVEVVRCKDCKNHEWCSIEEAALNDETFFCKLGERKDDEQIH